MQSFIDPRACGPRCVRRQRINREEPCFGDFEIGRMRGTAAEAIDHVARYMIAAGVARIEEKAMQKRRPENFDAGFLNEFAGKRARRRLACLNTAARQIPAGDIGMTDKEHMVGAGVASVDYEPRTPRLNGRSKPFPRRAIRASRPIPEVTQISFAS